MQIGENRDFKWSSEHSKAAVVVIRVNQLMPFAECALFLEHQTAVQDLAEVLRKVEVHVGLGARADVVTILKHSEVLYAAPRNARLDQGDVDQVFVVNNVLLDATGLRIF